MKNRTTLIYFILLVVSGSLTFYFIHYKQTKNSSNLPDRDFAVENIDDIGKIFLARKQGGNILLTRQGDDWMVNNKYKVFPNTMQYMLETIRNLKIKSIPPRNAYENIMKDFASIGIKVEIYNLKQELIKTYYVGGVTNDEEGLYCLMNGAVQPYIMYLGPSPTNLRVRYDIDEQDWRDRSMLNVKTEEIESSSLSFPYDTNRDYTVILKDQEFKVTDQTGNVLANVPGNRFINAYKQEFAPISTEAIINDHRAKDSICAIKPYAVMQLKLIKNKEPITLKFYPIPEQSDEAINMEKSFLDARNFYRFYICRQDGDFLLIQLPQMKNIFLDRAEFLSKLSKSTM